MIMSEQNWAKRDRLLRAGVKSAADLRNAARKEGGQSAVDFIIGLLIGASMLEQAVPGKGNLAKSYFRERQRAEEVLGADIFQELGATIGSHELVLTDNGDTRQQLVVALEVERSMIEVGNSVGATKFELMELLAITIVASVAACATIPERTKALELVAEELPRKQEIAGDFLRARRETEIEAL